MRKREECLLATEIAEADGGHDVRQAHEDLRVQQVRCLSLPLPTPAHLPTTDCEFGRAERLGKKLDARNCQAPKVARSAPGHSSLGVCSIVLS